MSISADVITSYKKIDEAYIDSLLEAEIKASNKKIVVLDDDPTGADGPRYLCLHKLGQGQHPGRL